VGLRGGGVGVFGGGGLNQQQYDYRVCNCQRALTLVVSWVGL